MSITLNVTLFVSLGWSCHKIPQIYFKNGPDANVTSEIINTPNFTVLFYLTLK